MTLFEKFLAKLGLCTRKRALSMAKWCVTYDDLFSLHQRGYNVGWPK
jgi:hypothetical protein